MTNAPERIWIEDEFGEGDDDQWTYGTWDARNYIGYDVEYVRADIVQVLTAERDKWKTAFDESCNAWQQQCEYEMDRANKAAAERDDAFECNEQFFVDNQFLKKRVEKAEAERDRLREALDGLLTLVEHANFEEGWCCCGDDMLHHQSPMDCGHTPVDMGEYHASLAIKEARAALKGETNE